MENNRAVLTQGCLITLTQPHGRLTECVTGTSPERNGGVVAFFAQWACIAALLSLAWAGMTPAGFANETDRLEVGEISAYTGPVTIRHSFTAIHGDLQAGAKVFIGDEIETPANSSIELLLGNDVRVRLAGGTAIHLNNREVSEKEEKDLKITTALTEILLRKGEIRVRVRENLITPTPVRVVAASMQLLLPRTDCLIRREGEGPENMRQIAALVGWGRCTINVRIFGDKEWSPESAADLNAPGEVLIPELPEQSYQLRWEKIGQEAADQKLQKLPFSIDQLRQPTKEIPKSDPEMDGA